MMQDYDDDKPVVAHFCRGYLAKTETFIGNQVTTLRRYRPIVLCHHLIHNPSYPVDQAMAVTDMLPPLWQIADRMAYGLARYLLPTSARALARAALEKRAQLLHFHFLSDARFFLAVKRLTKLPAIVSAYGHDVSSFPRKYAGYGLCYLKPVFDAADLFVAMSRDMRDDMLRIGIPDEKIVVHYHGTDTRRFAYPQRCYPDKDEVNILVCGTLEIKKAQHLVLEALWLAEQRGALQRRFRVTLVGDGPLRSHLMRQIAKYGWQDRVVFAGHVAHHEQALVEHYRQADILTLPSTTPPDGDKEGIPGTIVEATSSGLPVVSTYHAGIPEIIVSQREGLLVREGDVEGLASAYADLINSSSLRETLGRAAALRAIRELDLQQGTARLEHLYDELLEHSAPASSLPFLKGQS